MSDDQAPEAQRAEILGRLLGAEREGESKVGRDSNNPYPDPELDGSKAWLPLPPEEEIVPWPDSPFLRQVARTNEIEAEVERLRAEVARLEGEREAYHAYAARMLIDGSYNGSGGEWGVDEAVKHVAEEAFIDVKRASAEGWSAGEYTDLMNCRDAVAAMGPAPAATPGVGGEGEGCG